MFGIFSVFLLLLLNSYPSNGASILFLVMPQSASHRRSLYPFAEALGDRGHEVTFFSEIATEDGFVSKHPKVIDEFAKIVHSNPDFYDMWAHRNSTAFGDLLWTTHSNHPLIWNIYWGMMIDVCRHTVKQQPDQLKALMNRKWDLVVIDGIFAACGVVLTKSIKAPYIIFDATSINAAEASHRALPYPSAAMPPLACRFRYTHRSFMHRLHSAISYIAEYVMPFYWDRGVSDAVNGFAPQEPYVTWFYRNPEFVVTDIPPVLEHPRPLTRDIASVGGNCKSRVAELNDTEWLQFVNDPTSNGTIVLSFGHLVQWKWSPKQIVENIFKALGQFPTYRIAFQYDGPVKSTKNHIKLSPWLPVPGLLNHPKTKLHLTHGGVKSISESLCAGVPLVVLSMFAEQVRNANDAERIGAGLALDKFNMTPENIAWTIRTVLTDDRYSQKVKRLRSFMVEKPLGRAPMDVGVFWAEQVIKRKGLPGTYWKHKGRELSWIEYFNVDVIVVGLIGLVVVLIVLVIAAKVIWRMTMAAK